MLASAVPPGLAFVRSCAAGCAARRSLASAVPPGLAFVGGLGGVFPGAFAMGALERASDPRATALGVAIAAALACAVATSRLRERADHQGRGARNPWAAFGDVRRNPHARILLAVLFLEATDFASMTAAMPFHIQYALEREGQAALSMGGALAAMSTSIPVWLALARRFGKWRVWLVSLLGRAACFGVVVAFPDDGLDLIAPT
jgi:Na+/melibiose symporter-like transporter